MSVPHIPPSIFSKQLNSLSMARKQMLDLVAWWVLMPIKKMMATYLRCPGLLLLLQWHGLKWLVVVSSCFSVFSDAMFWTGVWLQIFNAGYNGTRFHLHCIIRRLFIIYFVFNLGQTFSKPQGVFILVSYIWGVYEKYQGDILKNLMEFFFIIC